MLALCLAVSCASREGALETIPRAPAYVLTVDDLVQRVRRSRGELAVQTGGVLVVGVVTRLGRPCELAERGVCSGVEGAYEVAPVSGGRARVFVLLGDARGVELGATYVVSGNVEVAPAAPERWLLRGHVMAKVAP
ncbi:MAG: hypothetical protein IPM79_21105 [Polyangiaceae bacterium]|nr:hypothetical protein [Polyangiaceae bacterium]MBK8940046.1 hypothetical protein [Polyangiaceae bacterium]